LVIGVGYVLVISVDYMGWLKDLVKGVGVIGVG
jgi:hypothetical protein